MEHRSGCALCGKELQYIAQPQEMRCVLCNGVSLSQAKCVEGHFVCDSCHSLSANDLIELFTKESQSKNPLDMAMMLMRSPKVKMHGPEHHFLVPAVLIAAFYNSSSHQKEKETNIKKARQRAEHVLGGFCGFYGTCGAAVGTGIFMSIVSDATPLSDREWRLSNLLTADSLRSIAHAGGPRCCKRNSFLAILEASRFMKEHFHTEIEIGSAPVQCEFYRLNNECKKTECRFYPESSPDPVSTAGKPGA